MKSNIPWLPILPRIVPSSHRGELPLARRLVATISDQRLVGVEMTCVSVTFGERIKDGLCCRCRTEGARRAEGADTSRAQETGTTVGLSFFLSRTSKKPKLRRRFVIFSGRRHEVDDKRGKKKPPLSVREDGAARGDTQMWATRTQTTQVQREQTGGALRMQKSPVEDANFLSKFFFW